MNIARVLRRVWPVLIVLGSLSGRLAAQNILYAELDENYYPVLRVHGHSPIVEAGGKMVVADGRRYTLRKTEEYLPVFIAIRNLDVKTRHLDMMGSTLNREFIFQTTLETPYDLDDVFLVLELTSELKDKTLYLQEVGKLEPGKFRTISATVRLAFDLGRGRYALHLFAGGREVLHSKIPLLERDAVVDRMTARRIAGLQDAAPEVFVGPGPQYPKEFLKARTQGQVIISIRVGANGQVYDPTVKSATNPAFGTAALEAVRMWRFLPRVVRGHPVETRVDVPFKFSPPEK